LRLSGNKFDLYYPTSLGMGGFQHPISLGQWHQFALGQLHIFVEHVRLWGFVIIALRTRTPAQDKQCVAGVNFLCCPNSNPVSIFFS